jgi:hypothetical protein
MPWHWEEKELLDTLSGTLPFHEIVDKIQKLDKRLGIPERSAIAIGVKMKRMGLSKRPTLSHMTTGDIARTLSVPRDRVELWTEKYGLKAERLIKDWRLISLEDFTEWAHQHPELLGGLSQDALEWLTGDRDFAVERAAESPDWRGRPMPVRRLDDNRTFPSIKAAARACYLHPASIRRALKKNGATCDGAKWEYY